MTTDTLSSALPPVRGQPFGLLVRTELRKTLDTRSGRALLLVTTGLAVVVLVVVCFVPSTEQVRFADVLGLALTPVGLLLPVVGLMAMTSEWSQRTALNTFTLAPRRVPVLLAKLVAAILLALVVVLVVVLLALAATAISGALNGGAVYTDPPRAIGGGLVTNALGLLMAAAFGALLANTALALVAYYVLPIVFSVLSATLLKDAGPWVDSGGAFQRLSSFSTELLPQTITSLLVWVLLPAVVGLWVASRREVK